jgi:hypothetical protein
MHIVLYVDGLVVCDSCFGLPEITEQDQRVSIVFKF